MSRPIEIPELSLVVLMGASGCGKSTFAAKHFLKTEVLSSDFFRGLLTDDQNDQAISKDAFETLRYIAAKRLALGKLTVVDATNVRPEDRQQFIQLARVYHCFAVAIALDIPEQVCQARNQARPDRNFGPHVVRQHITNLRRNLRGLEREGFRYVNILGSMEAVEAATIVRKPLWTNRKNELGPFDIIGDVHGCADELEQLLQRLGYLQREDAEATFFHPAGRKAIFVGDLVDRGPRVLDTIRIVRDMMRAGNALCVPGNHDVKFARALRGKQVTVRHGLETSLAEVEKIPEPERSIVRSELADFLDSLISNFVLDRGKLVVAHAGLREELQGRSSGAVREFSLYGETTGETDEFGVPVRYPWASEYRGKAMVVYGHTPIVEPEWLNNTICIDTGCVFGGSLTALRYPERELVSVPAYREYAKPVRPLVPAASKLTAQQVHDNMLDLEDVTGKRVIETKLSGRVTIREQNAAAALEVMSRFALDPRWLIYLPPTMSPCETSLLPDALEYPTEAFTYFDRQGVASVVCEEKHMGSRAVFVICRDVEAARKRFGIEQEVIGACYTRTGRAFFPDPKIEGEVLQRLHHAVTKANFWDLYETDWICLDAELLPWSAKAQELIRRHYAPVGTAARASLGAAVELLDRAVQRGLDAGHLRDREAGRLSSVERYRQSYSNYCWPVLSIGDLRIAPFHLLATEGRVHSDKNHCWHMEQLSALATADPEFVIATRHRIVLLQDHEQRGDATAWWEQLTSSGGEGMVVKPLDFITKGPKGIVQPAIKCRGREYLRIIYGPEYDAPHQIDRLRSRGLSAKRSLALREFSLGLEALNRFVEREPLRRVHECVFAVLALESEPVDPRL